MSSPRTSVDQVLIGLTARQLVNRRRAATIALVLIIPVVIALIFRFSDETTRNSTTEEFAIGIVTAVIATLLLPLVTLLLGAAALGTDIEDGTVVFLLTKPVDRWRIIVIKVGVASAASAIMLVPITMVTTWIIHDSPTDDGLMFGFGLEALVGVILYSAVFVALSAATSRPLIVGLMYVFVWEAFATNLFESLRWVSIREYASGWSDAFITINDAEIYDPRLELASAIPGSIMILGVAIACGTWALSRYEIGERS